MATQPNLGYGNRASTDLNTFNQWQRQQPGYQALIRSFGQDPNNVHLNDDQKQQVLRWAQAQGVVVDEGGDGQEVDDSGNFRAKGHKLKNALIVGGIAGAALLTAGLAGAFAPAAGAGAAAGSGGATAAGSSLAGLAGVEGGAAGLGDAALAGLGTGAMGAADVAGAGAAAAGANAAFDAAGNFVGPSTVDATGGGFGGALATGSKIAGLAGKLGSAVNGVDTALNGGIDANARGIGSANAAAQEAKNRILGAQVDQTGTAADTRALANMRTAGLMSNFQDTAPTAYGSPAIKIGDKTRDLASKFQDELLARQAAGKSLTANGVPDPSAQELADEAAARNAAQGKTGNGTLDKLNTGLRLAQLAPGVLNTAQGIWGAFA